MDYSKIKDNDIINIKGIGNIRVRIENGSYSLYFMDGKIYKKGIKSLNGLEILSINGDSPIIEDNSYYENSRDNNTINTNRKIIDENDLSDYGSTKLSDALGSISSTEEMIRNAEEILEKANIAENGIVSSFEALKNAEGKGLGTEAAISFFSLIDNAISTVKTNTSLTRDATIELNTLNKKVKYLLSLYINKKELEISIDALGPKPTYKVWTDENKNEYNNNDEIKEWERKYEELILKKEKLDKEIIKTKDECTDKYRNIARLHGNILGLDIDGLETNTEDNSSEYTPINESTPLLDLSSYTFERDSYTSSNGEKVNYYLYVPKYNDKEVSLPVHLYLPGAMDTEDRMLTRSLPKNLYEGKTVDGIVIMPISPYNGDNSSYRYDYDSDTYQDALIELTNDVVEKYHGDKERISLSGVSRGGEVGYQLVAKNPGYFSSFVAISTSPEWVNNLSDKNSGWQSISDTNILVIHGVNDTAIDYNKYANTARMLENNGFNNNKVTTILNNGDHGVDRYIFDEDVNINGNNEKVIDWALRQRA